MTITEFILARIAEDEYIAQMAAAAPTTFDVGVYGNNAAEEALSLAEREGAQFEAVDHLRIHDPARVLTQCETLRDTVKLHSLPHTCPDGSLRERMLVRQYAGAGEGLEPCLTLRLIAAIWSDHPDYDAAWRP